MTEVIGNNNNNHHPPHDNNNTKSATENLHQDKELQYYQRIILPMLSLEREADFVAWMQSLNLLASKMNCKKERDSSICGEIMVLRRMSKLKDRFQWKCRLGARKCSGSRSIREKSIFKDFLKCSLQDCVRMLIGWSRDMDSEALGKVLGMKPNVIEKFYKNCQKAVDMQIRNHLSNWQIGGPCRMVLIDIFPDGCIKDEFMQYHNNSVVANDDKVPILCIAEVDTFPTKYWFHKLDRTKLVEEPFTVHQDCMRIIKHIVKKGTIVVRDSELLICDKESLTASSDYPIVVSTDDLLKHETESKKLQSILGVIWNDAIDICLRAQDYEPHEIQTFLNVELWKRRHRGEILMKLLGIFAMYNGNYI